MRTRTRLHRGNDASPICRQRPEHDASLRNLELIGEAATHLPDAVREQNPAIPWRQIIATRNRLIHGYLGIDDDTLWSIITTDLPVLLRDLQRLTGNANRTGEAAADRT